MLPIGGQLASSNDLRHNASSQQPSQQGDGLRNVLRDYLDTENPYLQPKRERKYITKRKLADFWEATANKRQQILSLIEARHRYQLEQLFLEYNFQRVLCALIWTNEGGLVEALVRLIYTTRGTFTDVHLPWDRPLILRHIDELFADQFFENQYLFVEPIDIGVERDSPTRYDKRIPIPIVGRFMNAQAGLCKVRVHKSHLYSGASQSQQSSSQARHELDLANSIGTATELACSVLPRRCNIDNHLRHNSGLSKSLRSHANIATLIDVINRGDEIYLFLPFPELGDLESLLLAPLPANSFSDPVNGPLRDLTTAFEGVISGLEHLIDTAPSDVRIEINLTPRNIVRYFEAGAPFGRWKLLDFRIVPDRRLHREAALLEDVIDNGTPLDLGEPGNSITHQTPHHLPTTVLTINGNNYGDVAVNDNGRPLLGNVYNFNHYNLSTGVQSPLANEYPARVAYPEDTAFMSRSNEILQTPYVAPEVAAGSYDFDLRTSMWSLGCILLEIIAHSQTPWHEPLGSTSNISSCQHLRDRLDHGPFFELDGASASQHHHTVGARLNQHILDWLDHMPADSSHARCARIALQTLSFHPRQRLTARGLRQSLHRLHHNVESAHSSDASTDSTMEQASEVSTQDDNNVINSTRLSYLPVTLLRSSITSDLDACQEFVKGRQHLMISQTCVLLCWKPPRSATDEFWVRPADYTLLNGPSETCYLLPSGVEWQDLQLHGRYGTISSTGPTANGGTAEIQYYLFDIVEKQRHRLPEPIVTRGELQMIIPACNGLVAFCSSYMIYLRPIFGSVADSIDPFTSDAARSSSLIVQTTFNRDGTQLFVYITQGTDHYIQVWNVSPSQHATRVANANVGLNGGRSPQHINLVPCDLLDACIILHDQCLKYGVAQRGGRPGSIDTTGFLEDQLTARRACLTAATRGQYLLLMTSTRSRHAVRLFKVNTSSYPHGLVAIGYDTIHIEGSPKIVWAMIRCNDLGLRDDCRNVFEVLIRDNKGNDHSFELDPVEEPVRLRHTQPAQPLRQISSATSSASGSWLSRRLVVGRRRS